MKNKCVLNLRSFYLALLFTGFLVIAVSFPITGGKTEPFSPVNSVFFGSTGTSQLITVQGSRAGLGNGDYVSDIGGLDSAYRYFIEVPPGLSRLNVEIFDADVGIGGAPEANAGRDRARTGFKSAVRYRLLNPSGQSRNTAFTTGDATNPVGSDNAWLSLFDSTGDAVQDNFAAAVYSNNDGSMNWNTDWVETNDDNNPSTGNILITGGELRIRDNTAPFSAIQREADLSGFSNAVLSFNCRTENVEVNDQIRVEVSANGGATWTALETFTGILAATSRSYDISSFNAANTRVRFTVVGGYSGTDSFFVDNVRIKSSTITAGHWEVRVDMSSAVTNGDDINAFGLRAHDGTSGAGGTELNIYADSIYSIGVNPPASGTTSRAYELFLYLTSGCFCGKNDFDYDSNSGIIGSLSLESRTGSFTQSYSSALLSGDGDWRRDTFSGWTSDNKSKDYGIWTLNAAINSYLVAGSPNGNYTNLYFSNYQAATNPPAANPAANTFRIYFPTDAGTAPVKPYLEQDMIHFSGPNPPVVGQTVRERVIVRLVNPTAHSITFSASKFVTANVPNGVVYGGNAQVGQGSILSQPAVGGTGNITWNPGTVAAGVTTVMIYDVLVTPTTAGQRIPLTASPASGNGTRATFVDETGNATQARATYTLGPLCELAITVGNPIAPTNCSFPLPIRPFSLPDATAGVAYNQTFSPAVQLYSGTLPPGLTISGGTLSGVPTQTGTFSFVVGTPLNPGISPEGCASSLNYTLTVTGPTAARVEISGRVLTREGRGIPGASIEMYTANGEVRYARANSFGYFRFNDVEAGEIYVFQVKHKKYAFAPRGITINDSLTELNFEAQ